MDTRTRPATAAASLLTLLTLACGLPSDGADAMTVFAARRDGNLDIYAMRDGGPPERLTVHDAPDNYPRLSPDGRWMAFQSRRNGAADIYLMRTDGTELRQLTDDPGWDVLPSWSPDGRSIAFLSTRGFELGEDGVPFPAHVYVVGLDGAGPRQLSRERLTSSLGPGSWTPDGRSVTIARAVEGQLDVFLLDVETGEESRVTDDPADEYGAAVSPDGRRLAFHAETDVDSQIVVLDLESGERRTITSGPGRRYGPRWSRDGRWLVASVEGEGGQYDIVAMDVDTGQTRVILSSPEDEREPDWR